MSKREMTMPIRTLDDLTDLVNHNFQTFEKFCNKLAGKNRRLTVLTMAAIGCAVWSEVERRKQEEQIYQLSVRVKKLERSEGE